MSETEAAGWSSEKAAGTAIGGAREGEGARGGAERLLRGEWSPWEAFIVARGHGVGSVAELGLTPSMVTTILTGRAKERVAAATASG